MKIFSSNLKDFCFQFLRLASRLKTDQKNIKRLIFLFSTVLGFTLSCPALPISSAPQHSIESTQVMNRSATTSKHLNLLANSQHSNLLSPYITLIKEPLGEQWNFNQAIKNFENQREINFNHIPNLGFTFGEKYWGKIIIQNQEADGKWYLQIKDTFIEHIEFISIHESSSREQMIKHLSIDNQEARTLGRFLTYPINIEKHKTFTLYFVVHSGGPYTLPIYLYSEKGLLQSERVESYWLGAYYGILTCVLIFACFTYGLLRDITYFYYIGLLLFNNIFCMIGLNGLIPFIYPEADKLWQHESLRWFVSIGMIFAVLFSKKILEKNQQTPITRLLLNSALTISIICFFSLFIFDYGYGIIISNFNASIPAFLLISSAFILAIKGNREAVYFSMAWGPYIIGGLIFSLKHWSFIAATTLTAYSWQIGAAIESIFLSIIICRSIVIERKQKKLAWRAAREKDKLLHTQTQMKVSLEKEVKEKTQEISRHLYQDRLTGLWNHTKLQDDLRQEKNHQLAIISLNNFHDISDFYGPLTTEKWIVSLATRINKEINAKRQILFRLYRSQFDEFSILCPSNNINLTVFIEELMKILSDEDILVDDKSIAVIASAGIAVSKDQLAFGEYADNQTQTCASLALKEARQERVPYVQYSDKLSILKSLQHNISWFTTLKEALNCGGLKAFAQPIINLETKTCDKYEILVRLITREGEVVTPYHFLDVAHNTQLYPALTQTVVHAACKFFAGKPYQFSINIHMQDIKNQETVSFIHNHIRRYNVGKQLIIELVEGEGIEDLQVVKDFISSMRKLGCLIAIDDFGTGYSNYSYISRMHPDIIKIDGSLIKDIDQNKEHYLLVKSICHSCHQLGIKLTAEYVHSAEVLEKVCALDIDFAQGFLLGEPESLSTIKLGEFCSEAIPSFIPHNQSPDFPSQPKH